MKLNAKEQKQVLNDLKELQKMNIICYQRKLLTGGCAMIIYDRKVYNMSLTRDDENHLQYTIDDGSNFWEAGHSIKEAEALPSKFIIAPVDTSDPNAIYSLMLDVHTAKEIKIALDTFNKIAHD